MARWIILAVLVVILSAAATLTVQFLPGSATVSANHAPGPIALGTSGERKEGPKPKAIVEGEFTFNFGTLPQRTTGKHTWVVRNEGEGDLELSMISSTCSCTLAKFKNGSSATIKPGQSDTIDLEFETRMNNGPYEKGATIGTNDPNLPQFDLHVVGKVFPAVITIPPDGVVNLMSISNDQDEIPINVALYSMDRPDIKVLKITSSKPGVILGNARDMTPEEAKAVQIEKGQRVQIVLKPGLPLGLFREEVVITTDHPQQPETSITLTGRMNGPVNLIPDRLIMHQVNGKSGGRGDMIVSVRGSREAKIEIAKCPEGLEAKITPTDKKGRYQLAITVPPNSPAGEIDGEIVLTTDNPKAATVNVPISIWIQNSN